MSYGLLQITHYKAFTIKNTYRLILGTYLHRANIAT